MAAFVLDSFALLAYFRNEQGSDVVEELLTEAANDKHLLFITNVNAGEIYYISARKDGTRKAELAWQAISQLPLQIIEANLDLTLAAAKIKARHSLSYADAFAAALTIRQKATLVTGDKEFKALEGESGFKVKYL